MKTIEIIEAGEEMKTLETIVFKDGNLTDEQKDAIKKYKNREVVSYAVNLCDNVNVIQAFYLISNLKINKFESAVIILKPEQKYKTKKQ